jgi:hypothetical protein
MELVETTHFVFLIFSKTHGIHNWVMFGTFDASKEKYRKLFI